MDTSWLGTTPGSVLMVIVSAIGIYVSLIILTRLSGVRSFSKLSSFDFAITVAIGSLIASTILTKNPPLLQAIVALVALYALQMGVARFRNRPLVQRLVDNKPLLLMKGRTVLKNNMRKAKVNRSDLLCNLRDANVQSVDDIDAVVMETTGNITVLHGEKNQIQPDSVLMDDVREDFDSIDAEDFERYVDISAIEDF